MPADPRCCGVLLLLLAGRAGSGAVAGRRHIEPIGGGSCLVFEPPVLVDRGPSSGRLSAPAPIGSADEELTPLKSDTAASLTARIGRCSWLDSLNTYSPPSAT